MMDSFEAHDLKVDKESEWGSSKGHLVTIIKGNLDAAARVARYKITATNDA